jgi:hypothetical protein
MYFKARIDDRMNYATWGKQWFLCKGICSASCYLCDSQHKFTTYKISIEISLETVRTYLELPRFIISCCHSSLLHTHLSPAYEICDNSNQAAHYHIPFSKLEASYLTRHFAHHRVSKFYRVVSFRRNWNWWRNIATSRLGLLWLY